MSMGRSRCSFLMPAGARDAALHTAAMVGQSNGYRVVQMTPYFLRISAGEALLTGERNFTLMAAADAFPRAKALATRALDLDPALAEAHTSIASIQGTYEWDRVGAEKGFRRAIELNASYVQMARRRIAGDAPLLNSDAGRRDERYL